MTAPNQPDLRRIESVFAAALDRPAADRPAFLTEACAGDAPLRAHVDALLGAHDAARGAGFLAASPTARTALAADAILAETPGMRIGPYKILQLIGEGGFGTVFMADQVEPVQRRVALKVIKLGMDTRQVIARFEAERQALAIMDHPNIAKVLDAGATAAGRPYFVMELVKGDPITQYCDTNNLDTTDRLDLFTQVCRAVQHTHQKGIIHRDLKPSNILVAIIDGRAVPKVIDFGIAKATAARLTEKTLFTEHRALIGTPEYMSPEQAEMSGVDVDTRSDIYSLGVLLYELLTGTTPFDSKQLRSAAYAEIQRIIREVEPPKPSTRLSTLGDALPGIAAHRHTEPARLGRLLRGDLDWIVMKCLEKDRTRRYDSADSLAAEIGRYLADEPVAAGPPGRAYRLAKLVRRNRVLVAAGAAVALALVAGLAASSFGLVQARVQRDQKEQALIAAMASEKVATDQKSIAQRSLHRTAAIQDFFLKRMLRAVDPDVSGGEAVTVRQVLDRAAATLGEPAGAAPDVAQDPEVEAAIRYEVGSIYHSLGLYKEARPQLQRALAIREGPAAPAAPEARTGTADTLLALAHVLRLLEEPGRGEDLVRRARAIRVEVLGEESLPVAEADYHLAETLYRAGKDADAADINSRTLKVLDRLAPAGREPALHAQVLAAYATHLSRQGDKAQAAELLARAAEIGRRTDGSSSTRLSTVLSLLGGVLSDLGRYDEAERRIQESIDIRRRILPASHPTLAQAVQTLGILKMRTGHADQAEPLVREALEMYRAAYGPSHEFVATTAVSLGAVLASQQKFEEAARAYGDAAQVYADRFPPDDARLANARSQRGGCLIMLAKYDEAEQLLLEAHRSLAKTGLNPPALAKTVQRLIDLYQAWGKPDQVKEWQTRLESLGPGPKK